MTPRVALADEPDVNETNPCDVQCRARQRPGVTGGLRRAEARRVEVEGR